MAKSTDKEKTNVMRILDKAKIPYTGHTYDHDDGLIDGVNVAHKLGQNPDCVFKTLVTKSPANQPYVFVIPVAKELDLKKAAKAVGAKSVAMIHVSEINALTGYIRGGCSPVGMKKLFPTVFHESCLSCEHIMVSAGKIGWQVEVAPADLIALVRGKTADIIKEGVELEQP